MSALWTRLTTTWPIRASSPRTVRQAVRDVDDEPQSLALREEPEALDGLADDAPDVDVVEQDERAAALDPGEVEQLVDHLDEVAGLDLDLGDPIAHLRRDRRRPPRRRRGRASPRGG